jgi:hypothetical protein
MGCPKMGRKQIQICMCRPLNRTFGAKRGGVTEDCEDKHTEELLIYNVPPNITRMIKQRKRRRMGKLVCTAEMIHAYSVLVPSHQSNNKL